jgi:hypothetical protein
MGKGKAGCATIGADSGDMGVIGSGYGWGNSATLPFARDPTGPRAALPDSPDIWEAMFAVQSGTAHRQEAILATAACLVRASWTL